MTDGRGNGRGRAKSAGANSTFDEVLAVAQRSFANLGYDGTSMRDIARQVGIQPATLYSHFTSKEDILWKLVSTAIGRLHTAQDAVVDENHSPREALTAFVRCHALFHILHRDDALLVARRSALLDSERFQELRDLRKAYEHRLLSILQSGAESGDFVFDEVHVTMFAILQMGTGICSWYQPDGPLSGDEIADLHVRMALQMAGISLAPTIDAGGVAGARSGN